MKPPSHLTAETIAGYRARTLSIEELLAATAHLAECPECRQKMVDADATRHLLEALAGEHLSFEDLEAIAQGGQEGLGHVDGCETCAAELRDLRDFRTELAQTKPAGRRWRVLVPIAALAALILLLLIALPRTRNDLEVARIAPAASLRDNGRSVSLAAGGLDSFPASERAPIAEVLRTGSVPTRAGDPELVRSRETLLGDSGQSTTLRPVSPAGTLVLSNQPAFSWIAPKNARDFRVEVYNSDFERVAASGPVTGGVWFAAKPLPRGQVYSWTVSAAVNGKRITVPRAPEPEAKFRIATAADFAEMEAARNSLPASDLRVAITAARLGFQEQASAALNRLAAQNPGSSLVARLRASISEK